MSTAPKLTPPHGVCVGALLLGLCLWVILSSVSAARPLRYTLPTFLDTPVNITAYRGMDVELPCAVHNLGPKIVIWKKLNQAYPITVGLHLFDPDSSYTVVRPKPHESPQWNLRITDVQMKHAGMYECQISTKEDFTRNVTLTVIDAIPKNTPIPPQSNDGHDQPSETGIRLVGDVFAERGNSIILNCTASTIDNQPQGVDWFKDGNKIHSDSRVLITVSTSGNMLYSTLEILRSNMTDSGTYVCRSSKYQVASLKVNVLNSIRLVGDEYAEKGNSVILNCTASAIDYRPKGVDWFKDGNKIRSDSRVLITESTSGNVLYSTLEILRSNMTDAGTYVCRSSKDQVASLKVNVLNTDTTNKRRESGKDGVTSGKQDTKGHKSSVNNASSRPWPAPSSVLLSYALLCWPLLRSLAPLLPAL